MNVDYRDLADYAVTLSNNLSVITKAINNIESALNIIYSTSIWSGNVRDYVSNTSGRLFDNFDLVVNKFSNVNNYIDAAITNYIEIERKLSSMF